MAPRTGQFRITRPESKAELQRYYELRWRLLREPWGQPRGSEQDELETDSIHLMARTSDGTPVGVARLHFNTGAEAQIRYLAVAERFRGIGIGGRLLRELERIAAARGADCVILNARATAVEFFEAMGYRVVAPAHTLFGSIPHYRMCREAGSIP